jgi:hypothetical protein
MIIVMNSPSGYLGFYCAIIAATIKIVLLLVWGHYILSLLLVEIRGFTARYPIYHANCLGFIQ